MAKLQLGIVILVSLIGLLLTLEVISFLLYVVFVLLLVIAFLFAKEITEKISKL